MIRSSIFRPAAWMVWAVMSILILVTAAAPAQAHADMWSQGGDDGVIWIDHTSGQFRDQECDGNEVYMDLLFTDLGTRRIENNAGCHDGWNTFTTARHIWIAYLCEKRDGEDVCSKSTHNYGS